MKPKILNIILILITASLVACNDPTEAEFKKAQHFDFKRVNPKIVSVAIRQFIGDDEFTKDKIGQTYYEVGIEYTPDDKQVSETLRGIPDFVYDQLVKLVGKHYSEARLLTLEDLKRMEGRIVYRYIHPKTCDWMVVYQAGNVNRAYPVTLDVFIESRSQSLLKPIG